MTYPILFLLVGGFLTVLIEGPVLWFGLGRRYSDQERLFFAVWLTATTYPVVVIVLPQLISVADDRATYLVFAESFAIITECVLFTIVSFRLGKDVFLKELGVVVLANLLSFVCGELFFHFSSA